MNLDQIIALQRAHAPEQARTSLKYRLHKLDELRLALQGQWQEKLSKALHEDFDRSFRGVGITFLHVGNHVIDLIDEDHATGIVYCRGEIQDGGIDSNRFIIHAIQYHDTYQRTESRWCFVRRKHFLVYGAPLGENPLSLEPANWPASQTGIGSHPQALDTWQRFWAAGSN